MMNPFLFLQSKISSQSDFICIADLFRCKTDLNEKSSLLFAIFILCFENNVAFCYIIYLMKSW